MKKVKIMLLAIFVMAVVAGTLAFRVKKFAQVCLYTLNQVNVCAGVRIVNVPGAVQSTSNATYVTWVGGQCDANVNLPAANCSLWISYAP